MLFEADFLSGFGFNYEGFSSSSGEAEGHLYSN